MKIHKITYKNGMIKNLNEKEKMPAYFFDENSLPDNILDLMKQTKIIELGGTYGDPKAGNPIQYDHLTIEHDEGTTTIEAFNISIFLLFAEDPYIKKVFQVLIQFQLLVRK
ncbi:MAG: hypothetical protein WCE54_07115 [Ignavibacteriaceae bacterium]